jgi:hypothetical protein
MNTLHNDVLTIAANLWREASAIDKAVATILKIPGWQKFIKTVWPDVVKRLQGEKAKEAGPRELLISALVVLLSSMGIGASEATNPDTLKKVLEIVSDTGKVTQADIKEMADLIPFNVSDKDVSLLKNPLSKLFVFQKILNFKIENGMKEIKDTIQQNPKWLSLGKEGLTDLVVKGLMTKIDQPKYSGIKKDLVEYLQDKKQDLSFVEMVAEKTVSKYLEKNIKI